MLENRLSLWSRKQLPIGPLRGSTNGPWLPPMAERIVAKVMIDDCHAGRRQLIICSCDGWVGGIKEVWDGYLCCARRLHRQGIRDVKETISRAEALKEMAKKSGITVKDLYWTLGQYDVIVVCEAPDDEAATALALSVSSRGNVRAQTLRAFSFDEMKMILSKMV